jgi:tetratricopeptide (TPR) repeat protein
MRRLLLLVALFFHAVPSRAGELSTLVHPGWLRYSVEPRFELQRSTGARGLTLQTEHYVLPLVLNYGLVEGMEAVLSLPWVRNGASAITADDPGVTGSGARLDGRGLGDMALGAKYRLLEDSGHTPAVLLSALLKLPTGSSSLEAYARSLDGEASAKGTGSGSLDLLNNLVVSLYTDPLEFYVALGFDMRGGDARMVNGREHRVDYGGRMTALGGASMDVGAQWSLSLESLAIITQASTWRVDGQDVLASRTATAQSFRAAARNEGGINLATTTEWYVGPKLHWRITQGFGVGLRLEAGLTPDSLPWRAGLELSGALRPGRLLTWARRVQEAAPTVEAEKPGDQERGNLQRYLHRYLRLAESAAGQAAWTTVAEELNRLRELAVLDPDFLPRLGELQLRLSAVAEAAFQSGLAAADKGEWSAAAKAWKDLPTLLKGLPPGQNTDSLLKRMREKAKAAHRAGQDLYLKDQLREALDAWSAALSLDPGNKDVLRDATRGRTKLKALK